MIEIKNLYKRYHNHHGSDWVLRDINLTIPSGVSVGLIGANGAGKSTLLRLIAGMDTPERGEVIRHSRVSWPIGLSGGMQGSMTGRQNVKFVARAQGYSHDINYIVHFVEEFAEIGDSFDEPVKTYSSGMKARLSFGLSLAFEFDIYLSDEATSVGDYAFKEKAKKLFKERVEASSLIMVSHSEGILKELCSSAIYIKSSRAIWYNNINDAILDYRKDTHVENQDKNRVVNRQSPQSSLFDMLSSNINMSSHYYTVLSMTVLLTREKFIDWPERDTVLLNRACAEIGDIINVISKNHKTNYKVDACNTDELIKKSINYFAKAYKVLAPDAVNNYVAKARVLNRLLKTLPIK